MAETVSVPERVRAGEAALARGDWEGARAVFERELEVWETVEGWRG